jgi:hypothetical protein
MTVMDIFARLLTFCKNQDNQNTFKYENHITIYYIFYALCLPSGADITPSNILEVLHFL